MDSIEEMVLRRKSAQKEVLFLKSEILALYMIGTESFRQLCRAFVVVSTFKVTVGWIQHLFHHVFCKRKFFAILLNGERFLQLIPENG